MTDYTNGSQSKPVVLICSLFFVLLALVNLYLMISGPSENSLLGAGRSPYLHYPVFALCTLGAGWMAVIGFKRLKSM